ncbi:MAG: hydrogenase nickel incorporation protein HypB [Iamia sp.]
MCATCGCDGDGGTRVTDPAHPDRVEPGHEHAHAHDGHRHAHADGHTHVEGDGHDHSDGHTHDHSSHDHDHDHAHGDGHSHEPAHGSGTASDRQSPPGPGQHSHAVGDDRTHQEGLAVEQRGETPRTAGAAATPATETLTLEQEVLAQNDLGAARNRGWFEGRDILAVNLMSSPGSGKTTLLERTIADLAGRREMAVIEGDQETLFDADRIRATGAKVVQINTGSGCHLDADMLARGLRVLEPNAGSIVLIENVGNLVCPALFDLGEAAKVVIMSVTEGADKPLKYPHMFRAADLVVLNKVDLLPYVDFDVDRCIADARRLNPDVEVLPLSATKGDGLDAWYDWLGAHDG